jgi:hypothetical protein
LILIIGSSKAQEIKFKLYSYDPCSHKIEVEKTAYLMKGENIYYPNDSNYFCTLPDTGRYKLCSVFYKKEYFFDVKGKIHLDTLNLFFIFGKKFPIDARGIDSFYCCGALCNGKVIDYYKKNQIRFEGTFKNGRPVGTLKWYDPDGKLSEVEKYKKNGRLKKEHFYSW